MRGNSAVLLSMRGATALLLAHSYSPPQPTQTPYTMPFHLPFHLTPAQKSQVRRPLCRRSRGPTHLAPAQFEADGYLILPSFFSSETADKLLRRYDWHGEVGVRKAGADTRTQVQGTAP